MIIFYTNHPELEELRGTMLEPYVTLFLSAEERQEYNRLKTKDKIKYMKKMYKLGGWTCLLVGAWCIWGFGAAAIFLGLTLFWIGANVDDAKCY